MPYYTNANPSAGWILGHEAPAVIAVLEAPNQSVPVGTAIRVGWDHMERVLWTLRVYDQDLPGQWVVCNQEFKPVK
jgi:hypothetical protein